LFSDVTTLALRFAEAGLTLGETALRTAQDTVEQFTRNDGRLTSGSSALGPSSLDQAVSDLANRTARILYFTPPRADAIPAAVEHWLRALRLAFQDVDASESSRLALALRLPFALGTLMTDAGIRGLKTLEVTGGSRYIEFVKFCLQIFSEFPVYMTLEYPELLERQEQWVTAHPGDAAVRIELGRSLIKVGRYGEAIEHLNEAAAGTGDTAQRSTALHEAGVASFFRGDFEATLSHENRALNANPENAPARFWAWLAAQRLDGYPEWVDAPNRMEMRAGQAKATVEYEEISARIGLDKTSGGRGIAIFDYDDDGRLDVAIACAHGGLSLYRNNGDGTFADVSVDSGLYQGTNGFGIAAGDYENSGYPGLAVCRAGFFGGMVELWRNNGDGTFTDVSEASGVSCWGPSFTCSWCDYDLDGRLDLFVCTNIGGLFDRRVPHKLFHNNGDGTFSEVAALAGIVSRWPAIGHSWGDYDNDGYPDLFLSNAIGEPQLFHNNGDGTFTDVSIQAGLILPVMAFNAQFCDIDNDGWLDIIQYTWGPHGDTVHSMQTGEAPPHGHPTRVYRNNRDGTFTLISEDLGLTECWGSMSGNAADLNNDGYLDIALGNGGPLMDRVEPLVIYESDGERFRNVTFSAGLPATGKGHGINCADLFGDGRQIILSATGGAFPGDLLTTSVFAPKQRPGNYLAVLLRGTRSNRGAIGARIKLAAGGREQHRVVNNGSNFGCLPPQQHFGLGNLTSVDELEIWWPSGLRQRFEDLPVNTRVRITEGEPRWTAETQAMADGFALSPAGRDSVRLGENP
jgi:tetratricopeptide (TPR) repeat protein